MPHQRGWATSLQVAAGIANSLIDSYPFRPPPTHGESDEQKTTAGVSDNAPFPPLAEILTAHFARGWRNRYREDPLLLGDGLGGVGSEVQDLQTRSRRRCLMQLVCR